MTNLGQGDWDECIDRLYDAVGDEQGLASALGGFCPLLRAERASFFTVPQVQTQQSLLIAAHNMSHASMVEYQTHFFKYDEWVRAGERNGTL